MKYWCKKRTFQFYICFRIQYDGRGIQYGDCGIKINKVTKADKGIWSCITRIGTQFEQNEIYRNILLDVTDDDGNILDNS